MAALKLVLLFLLSLSLPVLSSFHRLHRKQQFLLFLFFLTIQTQADSLLVVLV